MTERRGEPLTFEFEFTNGWELPRLLRVTAQPVFETPHESQYEEDAWVDVLSAAYAKDGLPVEDWILGALDDRQDELSEKMGQVLDEKRMAAAEAAKVVLRAPVHHEFALRPNSATTEKTVLWQLDMDGAWLTTLREDPEKPGAWQVSVLDPPEGLSDDVRSAVDRLWPLRKEFPGV